jgi:predicted TIM-barrel fold metal-dependent hydrolase
MFDKSASLYPADGFLPPVERKPQVESARTLPASVKVYSADNHISVAEDIWHEGFPSRMKDRAPRVWSEDGIFKIGFDGQSIIPPAFIPGLSQIDGYPPSSGLHLASRLADLDAEGVTGELVFPNAVLALPSYPDLEVRELCFRVYNEYIAKLQAQAPGRFFGVGLLSWWDPKGVRAMLAEMKGLGVRAFMLPMKALGADGRLVDWTSPEMDPVLDEIEEAGLPICHHIGEFPPSCHYNPTMVGFLNNTGSFREKFGEYTLGGILDRHPRLRVGWFEGNISWVLTAIQDARHAHTSYKRMQNWDVQHDVEHYWRTNMYSSFLFDSLGLEMLDRIGADRVMWSSDYPHNEGSFGRSRSSLELVMDAVAPEQQPQVVGGNLLRFLNLP